MAKAGGRLVALASELGFQFVRVSSGGGHLRFWHPVTGQYLDLPRCIDESCRNYANYRAVVYQRAGVSARGTEATEGARHGSRVTGLAAELAARRAARIQDAARRRAARAIERREREVMFIRGLMGG